MWENTAVSASRVLAELSEVGQLVEFGEMSGLKACSSVAELGVGPLGIGWGALVGGESVTVVDPLPRLEVRTGDRDLDDLCFKLQARSSYMQADATSALDLPSGTFDVVVCDNVVDHCQDPEGLLREAHRLTKTQGHLLFGVNVFSVVGLFKWRYIFRRLHANEPNVICHPHSFLEATVKSMLHRTGWDVGVFAGASGWHRAVGRSYRVRVLASPR